MSKHTAAHACVIIDTAGPELSEADRRRLAHPLVGGVVLFARHWQDRAQLTRLCAAIKAVREDLLITVDQEGGRVQRFASDGFTPLPPMRALGRLWDADPLAACEAASSLGFVLASELRACGVDLSYTPVLDVDHGESQVIGTRAFHRDARTVTLLAKSLTHGLLAAGMAHCGKHFPGHGYASADSHHALPVDARSRKAILAGDALPYARLGATLTAVMPSHVLYPMVDAQAPASLSHTWITDVLRGELGFGGAVITDDLSMAAARSLGGREISYSEAVLRALNAGCDLGLVCNQSLVDGGAPLDRMLAELQAAADEGRWQPSADSEARRLALLPQTPPLAWDELMHDARYQRALEQVGEVARHDALPNDG